MIIKPRGTKDNFGINYVKYLEMIELISNLFKAYNFQPFATPLFESQNLFINSVGETSDIVSKEMYLFNDRKGRPLVLRPEGTAPIVRAVVENKLFNPPLLPLKIFYFGPMFRYERPQIGRSRQFDQIGIEVFGPDNLYQDLEVMRLIKDLVNLFHLNDDVVLEINYLIGEVNRAQYIKSLKKSCIRIGTLCDLCQIRLTKNPLRVLDCKEDQHKFNDLPKMTDYLTDQEKAYWHQFQSGLKEIGLPWKINHLLVRGLDYYTGLIFELKTINPILKSQNTFLAGGRYNNLVDNLGGPHLDALGFAIGTERLFEVLQTKDTSFFKGSEVDFYLWAKTALDWKSIDQLITTLHRQNFSIDADFISPDAKRAYRRAEQSQARNILLLRNVKDKIIISWKKPNNLDNKEYEISDFLKLITKENN